MRKILWLKNYRFFSDVHVLEASQHKHLLYLQIFQAVEAGKEFAVNLPNEVSLNRAEKRVGIESLKHK